MKPRLFLHIGQTKTGTTTLQGFLHANRDALLQRGFLYPRTPQDEALPTQAQHRFLFVSLTRSDSPSAAQQAWSFVTAQLHEHPACAAVISEEMFWHLRAPAIERMASYLREFDVHVRCYLRRQDLWIESWFNQHVKGDATPDAGIGFEDFVQRHEAAGWLDYARVLQPWADHFGAQNVRVRPYDRQQLQAGSVVDDFCQWIGLANHLDLARTSDRQARLSWPACELMGIFHRQMPGPMQDYKRPLLASLRNHPTDADPRRRIAADAARAMLARYAQSNADVARLYADSPTLFKGPTPEEESQQPYAGLSVDELAELMLHAYVGQQRQIRQLLRRLKELDPDAAA